MLRKKMMHFCSGFKCIEILKNEQGRNKILLRGKMQAGCWKGLSLLLMETNTFPWWLLLT